jgi:hypothetical protein
MQGHPESPRLWEKHADAILRDIELVPTVHEPCLYSGTVNGKQVIFKRQVDDFAIAAPDEQTANILLDLIDDELSIPIKRQGYLDMYNGIDVMQTKDYIKISCKTFINKICDKYLNSWMRNFTSTKDRPTPLPTDPVGKRVPARHLSSRSSNLSVVTKSALEGLLGDLEVFGCNKTCLLSYL